MIFSWLILICIIASSSSQSPNSTVCTICSCSNANLDCTSKHLEHHFNDSELFGQKFKNVIFNKNNFIHLKPFPIMTAVKLSFRNNDISVIDVATFRHVKNLTELDLSHNHLTSHSLIPHIFMGSYSPEAYEPLSALRILRLSGNSLHTLHPDLFEHLPNLKELSLDSNPFKMIDKPTTIAISSLLRLEVLDLSSTKIAKLPATMLHTPKYLEVLNISYNQFKSIPVSLGEGEESLQTIILDGNPISEITFFPLLNKLEVLHLNEMPLLVNIGSGSFKNLPNLKELSITNNHQLANIAEDALTEPAQDPSFPPLTKLLLNQNKLGYIGQHFVSRWDHITELDISMNPWVCDCENQWFLSTLMPHFLSVNPVKAKYTMCGHPIEMRGKNLANLSKESVTMRCLDTRGSRPEQDAFVLVAVLVGLLLAVPLAMASFALYQKTYGNASPLVRFSYHRASFVDTIS